MDEEKKALLPPLIYPINVTVGPNVGDEGRGAVPLTDRPFVLVRIKHQIVASGERDPIGVTRVTQDGLYYIDWSLYETKRFWKGHMPIADAAFGSVRHGIFYDLKSPVILRGNETINVGVLNAWGPRDDEFTVQVIFEGVERVDDSKAY